jgi:hypothetical protein
MPVEKPAGHLPGTPRPDSRHAPNGGCFASGEHRLAETEPHCSKELVALESHGDAVGSLFQHDEGVMPLRPLDRSPVP